jgi:hypothetical protein
LAVVLWKMPDSNIARTVWGLLGKTGAPGVPVVGEPLEPAAADTAAADTAAADTAAADTAAADTAAGTAETAEGASADVAEDEAPTPDVAAGEIAAPAADEAAPAEADTPPQAAPPPAPAADMPAAVNQSRLLHLTQLAVRRAEECHLGGRAVGKADAFLTFQPSGRVSEVRLEGEPVASAPVAKCVVNNLRSVVIKPYDGPPFTHSTSVTLR